MESEEDREISEEKYVLEKRLAYHRGCSGLLDISFNVHFNNAILFGILISFYCAVMDFTIARQYSSDYVYPITGGLFKDAIHCFDFLFWIATILEIYHYKLNWECKRPLFMIVLDVVSCIPYEFIYGVCNGTDYQIYYGLRLRYVIRFSRYVLDFIDNRKVPWFSIPLIITKYIVLTAMVCISLMCYKLSKFCETILPKYERFFDCRDLDITEPSFIYFLINGQITYVDLILEGTYYAHLDLFDAIVHFVMFIFQTLIMAKLVCTYIELLSMKYEFAILSNLVLWHLRTLKRSIRHKWTHTDEIFLKYLKKYLQVFWQHWNCSVSNRGYYEYAVATMPEVILTEITFDVSWNMFKHSVLFKNESVSFLRHVSMCTKYKILTEDETLVVRGEFNTKMVYLISGTVNVLSEQNGESTVISFSGGTCLGETNLFISCPASTSVVCANYCEFVVLERYDFQKIRTAYPETFKKLKSVVFERLEMARRYHTINLTSKVGKKKNELSLRYIKQTLRRFLNVVDKSVAKSKLLSQDNSLEDVLISQTVFCTEYLPMYAIAAEDHSNSSHFFRTGVFFRLNPNSPLVSIWNTLIYFATMLTCVLYPIAATLLNDRHTRLYDACMGVITFLWTVDFVSFAFTARTHGDSTFVDFDAILRCSVENPHFWIGFLSCFPIEWILDMLQGPLSATTYRALQSNRLLKAHKLLHHLERKQYFGSSYLLTVAVFKMIFTLTFLVLIGSYVVHIFDLYKHAVIKNNVEDQFLTRVSFIYQFYLSSALVSFKVSKDLNFVPLIVLQYMMFAWKLTVIPQVMAAFSLDCTTTVEYENFVEGIRKVFSLYFFNANTRRKVLKYLHLHYQMRKGLYILQLKSMRSFVGVELFKSLRTMMYHDMFAELPLFKLLPFHMILDLNEIPRLVLIPKGEFVVCAGGVAREIYIIVEGTCGYIGENYRVLKQVGAMEAILVLENIARSNVVHNIIALTDCKLLCLKQDLLIRKFLKYPKEYDVVMSALNATLRRSQLQHLQNAEIDYPKENAKDQNSFVSFHGDKEFLRGFGWGHKFFRHVFLNHTIRPNGKFWFSWEVLRIILAYVGAFTGSVPVTVYTNAWSFWFYYFRFLDLMGLIDLYLRHHVVFYNAKNIEVTHPWETAKHYWSGSFVTDVCGWIPLDLIMMPKVSRAKLASFIVPRLNRYLQLYRIFGMRRYLNETYMSELKILLIIYYTFFVLLLSNLTVQYFILCNCDYDVDNDTLTCLSPRPYWPKFFKYLRRVVKNLFTLGLFEGTFAGMFIQKYCLINVVGLIMMTIISGVLTGISLFRNSHLTMFQIKMQRLVNFMNLRKIDKNLRREIIKYYEYMWILREGKSLRKTFQDFNIGFYEELMYAEYGNILKNSILFKGFPRAVLKDFLSCQHISRDLFLIHGVIIRVNDVQGRIFILFKGNVEVLGPDYSKLETLNAGSIFGCLDNVARHRSTITYVAKTHCELLSLDSANFYEIIQRYTRFYKNFMHLMRSSNFDYINSKVGTTTEKFGDTKSKQNHNVPTLTQTLILAKTPSIVKGYYCFRFLLRLFKVQMPNERRTIFFALVCFASFIAECCQKIVYSPSLRVTSVCYFFDLVFWLKIYLHFSTAYENAYGLLVRERKLIALRYLQSSTGFFFDFLFNFPFELISLFFVRDKRFFAIWSFCRINRLMKILNVFWFVRSVRNRLNVNVFLIRGVHILLLVVTLQQLSMILISHDEISKEATTAFGRYVFALSLQTYFMSTAIHASKGLSRQVKNEYIYYNIVFNFLILVTQMVTLYVFIECISSYQVLNYSRCRYWSYLQNMKNEMKNKRVSWPLRKRVVKYFSSLAGRGRNVQFPSFVREAPYYLREGVLDSMFGFHLRRHPIFKRCHCDLIRQIAATFETMYFFPGDFIAFIGDIDCKMYFIHEGTVACLSEDNLYYDVIENKYKSGDYFGFRQLFNKNVGHNYTYKVLSESTILILRKEWVIHLLDFFPASKNMIYSYEDDSCTK